jgi:hypothetical protein
MGGKTAQLQGDHEGCRDSTTKLGGMWKLLGQVLEFRTHGCRRRCRGRRFGWRVCRGRGHLRRRHGGWCRWRGVGHWGGRLVGRRVRWRRVRGELRLERRIIGRHGAGAGRARNPEAQHIARQALLALQRCTEEQIVRPWPRTGGRGTPRLRRVIARPSGLLTLRVGQGRQRDLALAGLPVHRSRHRERPCGRARGFRPLPREQELGTVGGPSRQEDGQGTEERATSHPTPPGGRPSVASGAPP